MRWPPSFDDMDRLTVKVLAGCAVAMIAGVGTLMMIAQTAATDPALEAHFAYLREAKVVRVCVDGTRIYRGPDGRLFLGGWGTAAVESVELCSGVAR